MADQLAWLHPVLEPYDGDVLVFGSAVMLLHGLRDDIGDVDLFVPPSVYRLLRLRSWEEVRPHPDDPPYLEWVHGRRPIHAFVHWTYRDVWLSVREAWARSHWHERWHCVDLDLLLDWKRRAESDHPGSARHAKHARDAAVIDAYLNRVNGMRASAVILDEYAGESVADLVHEAVADESLRRRPC